MASYAVDVNRVVVIFVNVKVKVKVIAPNGSVVVAYEVVTVTCITFTAGASEGTRDTTATTIKAATTAVATNDLLKTAQTMISA